MIQDGVIVCGLQYTPVVCYRVLTTFTWNVSPLQVYDHCTLLNIHSSVEEVLISGFSGQSKTPLSFLAFLAVYCVHPACSRRRRRGRKVGVLVRLEAHLVVSSTSNPCRGHLVRLSWDRASYDMKCSSEYCYRWLWLTVLAAGYLLPWHRPIRICGNFFCKGMNHIMEGLQWTHIIGDRRPHINNNSWD